MDANTVDASSVDFVGTALKARYQDFHAPMHIKIPDDFRLGVITIIGPIQNVSDVTFTPRLALRATCGWWRSLRMLSTP